MVRFEFLCSKFLHSLQVCKAMKSYTSQMCYRQKLNIAPKLTEILSFGKFWTKRMILNLNHVFYDV